MKGPMPTGTSTPARGTCRSEVRLLALLTELSAGGRCWNGSRGGRGPFSPGRVNEGVKMSGAPDSIGQGTCQGIELQAEVFELK